MCLKKEPRYKILQWFFFLFREHPGGTYVRILTFVFLLTLAPPVQAQMLDSPVFQLQEQSLSNGYFN